jgi:hypothetical protein
LDAVQDHDMEFEKIFGPGAAEETAQLAIEFQDQGQVVDSDEVVADDTTPNIEWKMSTPKRRRKGKKIKDGLNTSMNPIYVGAILLCIWHYEICGMNHDPEC